MEGSRDAGRLPPLTTCLSPHYINNFVHWGVYSRGADEMKHAVKYGNYYVLMKYTLEGLQVIHIHSAIMSGVFVVTTSTYQPERCYIKGQGVGGCREKQTHQAPQPRVQTWLLAERERKDYTIMSC